LHDIDITERLELDLGLLATDEKSHSTGADCAKGRSGSVVVPTNSACLASCAGGRGNWRSDVEVGESLGDEGGSESSGEDGGEHGDYGFGGLVEREASC